MHLVRHPEVVVQGAITLCQLPSNQTREALGVGAVGLVQAMKRVHAFDVPTGTISEILRLVTEKHHVQQAVQINPRSHVLLVRGDMTIEGMDAVRRHVLLVCGDHLVHCLLVTASGNLQLGNQRVQSAATELRVERASTMDVARAEVHEVETPTPFV